MSDIEKLAVWATTLVNVEEPESSLQSEGYVGGDQPFAENHNWIWWQRDTKMNQLIDGSNYGKTQAAGIAAEDQVTELYLTGDDWLHPWSDKNKLTLVSTPPIDMCPGWDYSLQKHVVHIARLGYQGITSLWNGDSGEMTFSNLPLTLDNAAEQIDAICSDGSYLYAMTTGKPGFQATFYKFSMNPVSSTKIWSRDSSLLFNQSKRGKNDLIIADADWIATPLTDTTPDSGLSVFLINKDGLTTRQGKGNAPNTSSFKPSPFMASNGTNLFFGLEGISSPYLATADIADPTQSTYPGGTVTSAEVAVGRGGIGIGQVVHDGQLIHYLLADGSIYSYDWATNTSQALTHAQWEIQDTPSPQVGTANPAMTFDGMHMWALVEYAGDTDNDSGFVIPVNVGAEGMDDAAAKSISEGKIMIQPPLPTLFTMRNTKMVYADNCLFLTIKIDPGGGSGFEILRIPNLQARKR
jgi:hypothetical protein